MTRSRLLFLLAPILFWIVLGTVFFRHVEGWSWLDSYFFTVVTLSTVGYGSLVPMTSLGKIGATVLIFFGLAVFAVAIQQLGASALMNRAEARRVVREARNRADRNGENGE